MSHALAADLLDPLKRPSVTEKYGLMLSQTTHRIELLQHWGIKDGDRILELGCGQGDCTTVLALMYPQSSIDAVDPASLNYGAPETLGQAHERIRSYGGVGSRITFHQASPIAFLGGADAGSYDVAILCHCLWYFGSKEEVVATFAALAKAKVRKLCIAEWSLKASTMEAQPHVLAAFTTATCEAYIPDSDQNIRTLLSPQAIQTLALQAGWRLQSEVLLTPGPELDDAKWELGLLSGEEDPFLQRAKREIKEERIHTVLESMLDSVKSSVEAAGGKQNVRCMDVWEATFTQ